jgi:CRP-like cAMP-binding protein
MSDKLNNNSSPHCNQCPAFKKSAFHSLSKGELDLLQENKSSFEISRGEHLNEKGSCADGAYCLASGFSKIVWQEKDNSESIVKLVGPGDMAGYRCLFTEKNFRATAISLGKTHGCFISRENFIKLVETHPNFNKEILARMSREIKLSEERLHSYSRKNVRERMAHALLLLKDLCGNEKNGVWVLEIHLTREELSSWIGSVKETVVRCLTDMKEEKVIAQEGSFITLLDIQALNKIAGL